MNVKVIAEVWPAATFKAKLDSDDINSALLFGTNGEDGLVINADYDDLRKSVDGTRIILKTRCSSERVEGVDCPISALMARADEEGLSYVVYSDKPCSLVDGEFAYLEDDTDWGSSALPNIHSRLSEPDWVSEEA